MSVCFTNKNIHVQFIDDSAGVTVASASTASKATPERDKLAANAVSAKTLECGASRQQVPKTNIAMRIAVRVWSLPITQGVYIVLRNAPTPHEPFSQP